jgi:RimJ/RimL family protein N-acetyltransferase
MSLPVLFTSNLILRPANGEDFEAWAAFHADEETMRYLGGTQVRAVAWRGLCALAGAWTVRGYSMFSVIERDSGRWVGRVGPWRPEGWPRREIAWGVAREYAGRGYAHEAAVAAIDYAVDLLGWPDIAHHIDPANARSIRLAERLGAVNRGPTSLPAPLDQLEVDNWGQSAESWRGRGQAAATDSSDG